MKIRLEDGLPIVSGSITIAGRTVALTRALLDTGSGGTLVSADRLLAVGIEPDPADRIVGIRGVGGVEFVVRKQATELRRGELVVRDTPVQIGSMSYGFELDGIVGTVSCMRWEQSSTLARSSFAPRSASRDPRDGGNPSSELAGRARGDHSELTIQQAASRSSWRNEPHPAFRNSSYRSARKSGFGRSTTRRGG